MNHRIYDDQKVVPFLDLDELKLEERSTTKTQIKICKIILAKCHEMIKRKNRESELKQCVYEIPLLVPGYPGYNFDVVQQYLLYNLSYNGLYVQGIGQNKIFISWQDNHINRQIYEHTSQKVTQKHNIYKVTESPIKHEMKKKHRHNKDEEAPSSVSMMQYNQKLPDLIPVNTKKAMKIYEDVEEDDDDTE